MIASNVKKKKSPGQHLLYLAALSAIIVYSYNSILEPLMFGDIEYGSATHKQMYSEDLRRVLTASGRAGEYERLLQITNQRYWDECFDQGMTVIACKDFIDEEILTFTEDNPLDPRYGYDPRDRFVRTRIVGKRSEQDFWYNTIVIRMDENDMVIGRDHDGVVHYDFAWDGSGEAATDEQVAAIPPILGVETTSGFIEGQEKETTYYPSPSSETTEAGTETGSTESAGGTVDNTAGTTDGSGSGTTGATSGPGSTDAPVGTEGGGSTEAPLGTNTEATQSAEGSGPTTAAPPEEETTTGTTTTVSTTTTTTTTVETTTTTTDSPVTTSPEPQVTQTEGTAATYVQGGQVGGGGFNVIAGGTLTFSPSASPTIKVTQAVTTITTEAPIIYSNGTDGEGPIIVFEEAQYVDGESNLTAAYEGESDLPIAGGIVISPDATSTEEGQAKLDAAYSEPIAIPNAGQRLLPEYDCAGMTGYDCCLLIKHDNPDHDVNGVAIQCFLEYAPGTGKNNWMYEKTSKKVLIHDNGNGIVRKPPKLVGNWGNESEGNTYADFLANQGQATA